MSGNIINRIGILSGNREGIKKDSVHIEMLHSIGEKKFPSPIISLLNPMDLSKQMIARQPVSMNHIYIHWQQKLVVELMFVEFEAANVTYHKHILWALVSRAGSITFMCSFF